MLWNININFGIPSEDDVAGMAQSLEDMVESYDFGDIDKELDRTNNRYVVNDIRAHMIVKFRTFLEFVKEETQFADDDFKLNLEDLNRHEAYFWCEFIESLESLDEGVINDYSIRQMRTM